MKTFEIGDIVAFNSHPYFPHPFEKTSVVISGESILTPPLMVIGEILIHRKGSYDPQDGVEIFQKGSKSCKCYWYNHDSHQFEESWFLESQLNLIQKKEEVQIDGLLHSNIIFKTAEIEVGKRKSALSTKNGFTSTTETHINSFVAPVMQVIQVKKAENKEPKYHEETGNPLRIVDKYQLKCKWYNPKAQKFSEKFLPINLVQRVPSYTQENLEYIHKSVENQSIYLITQENRTPILFQVKSVFFLNGWYYFKGYDFIKNSSHSVPIDPENLLSEVVDSVITERWPDFDESYELIYLTDFLKINKSKPYLQIQYESYHGEVTTRTISKWKIEDFKFPDAGDPEKSIFVSHLVAYCHLRDAERRFRLDKIRKVNVLNIP